MSMIIKISILFALMFITGVLLGLKHQKDTASQTSVNEQETHRLALELDALKKQYANDLANTTAKPTSSMGSPNPSLARKETEEPTQTVTKAELIAAVERVQEIFRKDPNFDMDAAQRKIFESEPIDSAWALPREEAISQAFKSVGNLQIKTLKSIECRAKHCRIEVYYQNLADTVPMAQDIYAISRHEIYGKLFWPAGDMSISQKDKVLSVYLISDSRVTFF